MEEALLATAPGGDWSAFLDAHLCPAQLASPWRGALERSLREGALGPSLAGRQVTRVEPHDSIRYVFLSGQPTLMLTVESSGCLRSVTPTSCARCDEGTRFVTDLLALARAGSRELLHPGYDLSLARWLKEHPEENTRAWWGALARRNLRASARLLSGYTLVEAHDLEATLRRDDGTEERWSLVQGPRGTLQLDYASLPPDSPLRLSAEDAERWGDPSARARDSAWNARWDPENDAILLGDHVVGAAVHPLDDTALLITVDPTTRTAAAVRLDLALQEVLVRTPLPTAVEYEVPVHPQAWSASISADLSKVLLREDGQGWLVALPAGESQRASLHKARALALAAEGSWAAAGDARVSYHGDTPWSAEIPAAGRAIGLNGAEVSALLADGSVWTFSRTTGQVTGRQRACDKGARGGALDPQGTKWAAICIDEAPQIMDLAGGQRYALGATALAGHAAAWSPDGRALLLADQSALVLWDPHEPLELDAWASDAVESITWAGEGRSILVLEGDGEARLWTLLPEGDLLAE